MRKAADAEVAEERLGGHVGELHPILDARLFQLIGHVEQVLVGGTEAPGPLRCADDHIAGIVQEFAPSPAGLHRIVERRDRMSVSVGSEPGDDVEVVAIARRDDQIVVAVLPFRRAHLLRF